jgi:hypothetical protein
VPGRIEPIVDNDIRQAVENVPGVSGQLSFATWGAALFAETKLGYEGFYAKYFTTALDWQIFYNASGAACTQTAIQFPAGVGQGAQECLGVFGAAYGFALEQNSAAQAAGAQAITYRKYCITR